EDSDKEDQDLDKMFGAWLGELDKLTQSLDDGRPGPPPAQQKAPLRQETNMANFSYRFSVYNINGQTWFEFLRPVTCPHPSVLLVFSCCVSGGFAEALNQGENVDLDALMADLSSIEQELSTINSKPNSSMARLGLTDTKVHIDRTLSLTGTIRAAPGHHGKPALASNFSLDDITAQLEKASLSMDEAARQTSSHSLSSASSTAATVRRPGSSQRQHRRTGSVGTVSEQEVTRQQSCFYTNKVCAFIHSSRSSMTSASGISVNSASSMDSLDSVLHSSEAECSAVLVSAFSRSGPPQFGGLWFFCFPTTASAQPASPPSAANSLALSLSFKHSYLDKETSLILRNIAGKPSHLLTKEEQAAKLKADNIRVALEKIKEAQVKKLVIRVHLSDESSKTMMVDERQTVRQVLDSLLEKSHSGYSPDWSLVETISELQMERIFEDHENLVENLLNWTRDSQNRLMFTERIEKYAVFKNPQNYLLGRKETCEMTERNKEALLEECFGGSSVSVPEMEGLLWLKEDGKKSWKKRYFLLRASGIYYVPKGKAKASRDLVCFLQLDHVNVYLGQDYKSKYKAPTDYCMVLKHPQIQKKSQYIKYLCCDDIRTLQQWINSIRIAKSPSRTTPASRTAGCLRWCRWATPAPRASSAPYFPTPGGEERRERFHQAGAPPHAAEGLLHSDRLPQREPGREAEEGGEPAQQVWPGSSEQHLLQLLVPLQGRPQRALRRPGPPPQPGEAEPGQPPAGAAGAAGGPPARRVPIPSPAASPLPAPPGGLLPGFFPPPPSASALFPPPPPLSALHQPPQVAVVNPQPQLPRSAPTSLSSSWPPGSLRPGAVPPPALHRRPSNPLQYDQMTPQPLSPPPVSQTPPPSLPTFAPSSSSSSSPVPPTSPKSPGPSSLALKPLFLEDLNRTLKRKSISRHGSLTSSHLLPARMEPVGTMDDMALLPPPPPELLQQQQQQQQQRGVRGQSHTLSRHHTHSQSAKHANISGYATLRRGPPPVRPNGTKAPN
ncbi:unnamed protein product, partial [Tetraodon nigroviridis]